MDDPSLPPTMQSLLETPPKKVRETTSKNVDESEIADCDTPSILH